MTQEILQENHLASKKQKLTVTITVVVILLLGIVFALVNQSSQEKDIGKIIKNSRKIIIQDPNAGIKAEDRWLYNAQKKLGDVDEFMKDSEQSQSGLEARLNQIEQNYQDTLSSQEELIANQNSEIEELKGQVASLKNKNSVGQISDPSNINHQAIHELALNKTITTVEINLEQTKKNNKRNQFNIDEYIPAGAYAPAVIISGVDASVGLTAQSDPRPVLLRVKGPAVSSIYDGNFQKSDLTGCLITGAASGDLSSEKVYVKLINMTCGEDQQTVSEVAIKGYVAGQGKSGIRGYVVSREGDLLAKSFLAGLISGFGQGLSDRVAPPLSFSNGLTTQQAMSAEDVAKRGLGKGISSASDRVGNYLINRAEQYQPIVSIPSGIEVEVVFLEGFYLGNRKEEHSRKTNNNDIAQNP